MKRDLRAVFGWAGLALFVGACTLNPQPLPPAEGTPDGGTMGADDRNADAAPANDGGVPTGMPDAGGATDAAMDSGGAVESDASSPKDAGSDAGNDAGSDGAADASVDAETGG